ncbi:barstar family protein [Cohnella abietis]|uniref:Barstar (barnase inhibitor) domain-containing protein n=1 Tax=Cohnella abietis TaxID=2507935 RepID=A0A3T1D6X6_9BACL|nr:barstar family protein [Cohnella abietis]BBI33836.1 hypothetical protein KCTCHS21_32350 [Cohnella abietis]
MDKIIENKVLETNIANIYSIKSDLLNNKYHIAEISGAYIQTWEEYVTEIQSKFIFPTACIDSMDRYLDWIRDLDWLGKDGYALIIYDFSEFLKNAPKLKQEIVADFTDIILPFWQEEVEEVVVGAKAKAFMVYLVD